MRFPQTFIDDLRRQADIVRIVQDYVTLKKTGANWVARCPFHKETKPSFSVNPSKEIFYCFGCQKGGSVFNFIMEIERVAFPEAIKIVAEKSGVPLPKMVDDSRFEARKRESDQVIELNQWALQWWQDQLQSKAATSVRQYLKQRGLTEETANTFRLGFAILVEGYLDLIVPYQFGVRNVAASLGTALTPEQVKLIARFARKVLVNYDGDRAGVQAAKRAIETLLAEDLEVKVLVLPDNADPDDFIRKYGVTEYQQRRSKAQPHIQFVIDQAVRDRNLHNPADKAAAVEETLPFVRAVRGRIQRREYFDIAMDALRVQTDQRRELWQRTRGAATADGATIQQVVVQALKPTVAEEKLLLQLLELSKQRSNFLPAAQASKTVH